MHLLLHPELVAAELGPAGDDGTRLLQAVEKACAQGWRVWMYAGCARMMADAAPMEKLKVLSKRCHWLAALAGEGDALLESDPRPALQLALKRLPGPAHILTRAVSGDSSGADFMSLDDFLDGPVQRSPIDFIDLKGEQDAIRAQLESGLHTVLHHGRYILGPEISELEERLASWVGTEHCITVASGTDSLLIALMALGTGPGDEVITVPYTWISTAEVIALLNATPVFVDIDPDTYNLDPSLLERAITSRTKAMIPVGLYGQCAEMERINAIAAARGIPVIEDAAQSFGAARHGVKSCALSRIGSTSFFPSKPLGCYGDGGALFTADDGLAERMRQIRVHGQAEKHLHPLVGLNGRFDTLQAAVLLAKLEGFEDAVVARGRIGERYTRLFRESLGEDGPVKTPVIAPGNTSVYAQYTIQIDEPGRVQAQLWEKGIPSVSYYVVPLHLQPVFDGLGLRKGAFPVAEAVSQRCLSLPMSPGLTESDQERVVDAVCEAAIERSPVGSARQVRSV
ncbi:MAG TPA: DegT/DnrJ/EryC1/StrS family aminotransferase [Verrucomicrobiales bacterium]|nr:DegT/DnrJ/EryC1/StrS family aminotransferase [Verrucomicrobiales bacterium]